MKEFNIDGRPTRAAAARLAVATMITGALAAAWWAAAPGQVYAPQAKAPTHVNLPTVVVVGHRRHLDDESVASTQSIHPISTRRPYLQ